MKIRHYKRHTFKVCMAWVRNPNVRNTDRLAANLTRWSRGEGDPYDYSDTSTAANVEYCSDRMNPGRAKAILMQWGQESLNQLDALFGR